MSNPTTHFITDDLEACETMLEQTKRRLEASQKEHAKELRAVHPIVFRVMLYPIGNQKTLRRHRHCITHCASKQEAKQIADVYSNDDWQGSVIKVSSSSVSVDDMISLGKVSDFYRWNH